MLFQKKDIKKLVDRSSKFTKNHPYFVVIVMHELFRNLYYFDPYIKSDEKDHYKRLKFTVNNLNNFLNTISSIGSYKKKINNEKYDTQILFGKLWEERKKEKKLNSSKVLIELLKRAKISLNLIKGKKVLDMIERLKEKGVSVLIISHNLEHVFSIADRISVLKNGRMVGTVSPKQVNRSDVVRMITTGESVDSDGATQ